MMNTETKIKYEVRFTNEFKKDYKRIKKQGKNLDRLKYVVSKLANNEILEEKYKNHMLTDSKYYKNCGECHITPDWLLLYQYIDNKLILLLVSTGSHSELFD